VDRQAMLLRIDFGKVGGVLLHEMEVRRRDDPRIVLERRVESDVINAHPHSAALLAVDVSRCGLCFRLG
jgi:hypothetical protein